VCFEKNKTCKIRNFKKEYVDVTVDGLYDFYLDYTTQQMDHWSGILTTTSNVRDTLLNWCLKHNVCPWALITKNSSYWLETINLFDGEMGLTLPYKYEEVPFIFHQALGIIRKERNAAQKEKHGDKKNSDSNKR